MFVIVEFFFLLMPSLHWTILMLVAADHNMLEFFAYFMFSYTISSCQRKKKWCTNTLPCHLHGKKKSICITFCISITEFQVEGTSSGHDVNFHCGPLLSNHPSFS